MDKIYEQLDIETIEKLAGIVRRNELSEITIGSGDNKITIKGKKCPPPPPMPMPMPMSVPMQMTGAPAAQQTVQAAPEQPAEMSGNVVKSPIVGTFYAAPSPDKAPFVRKGDTVNKGDVIMIIESMKLMNEIQSEFSGVVKEILVSDGQAVEFEQPIMIIE